MKGGEFSVPLLRRRSVTDLYNVLYRSEMSVDPHDIPNSHGELIAVSTCLAHA